MAVKRGATKAPEPAEVKTKPVRVDLPPVVHKALRKEAAERETSMAALARTMITLALGFEEAT
jgi:hypothetical protein